MTMRTSQLFCGLLAGAATMAYGSDSPGAVAGANIPELPELNWEKRSDWIDVTKDVTPAAVGDGVADDTAALQAAFDKVCGSRGEYSTVYIPPGTYRITRQISPIRIGNWQSPESNSLRIRGHGRSTRIVWDGPEGGTMFLVHSFGESTYIGTVWDGRGKAARGFMHDGGNESHVLHEHQAFMSFTEQGSGVTEARLSNVKKAFQVVCTGEAPLDVLLMANAYQQKGKSPPSVPPAIEGGSNVTRTLLGNAFTYLQNISTAPVPNVLHANSLRLAAQALDDFRELGELDLELNHTAPNRGAVNE